MGIILQNGAEWVMAIATVLLFMATAFLTWATFTLAKKASYPFVVCRLESSPISKDYRFFNLTFRNTGNATTFDIKLTATPPIPDYDGTIPEKSEYDISLLPPGEKWSPHGVSEGRFVNKKFLKTPEMFEPDGETPKKFTVKISWADLPGKKKRKTLSYIFETKDGFRGGWRDLNFEDLAKATLKIAGATQKIAAEMQETKELLKKITAGQTRPPSDK